MTKIFTLNTWYFIYDHSGWVPNWHKLLSGVLDALCVRMVDLRMINEPNCHIIMFNGGQKSQNPHLWTQFSLWTLDTWCMVTLGRYPIHTIAFKCSRCFVLYNYGTPESNCVRSNHIWSIKCSEWRFCSRMRILWTLTPPSRGP